MSNKIQAFVTSLATAAVKDEIKLPRRLLLEITGEDQADGTNDAVVQAVDDEGNDVNSKVIMDLIFSDQADGAPTADLGSIEITVGEKVNEPVTDQVVRVISDADGKVEFTFTKTTDGTVYVYGIATLLSSGSIAVTGN